MRKPLRVRLKLSKIMCRKMPPLLARKLRPYTLCVFLIFLLNLLIPSSSSVDYMPIPTTDLDYTYSYKLNSGVFKRGTSTSRNRNRYPKNVLSEASTTANVNERNSSASASYVHSNSPTYFRIPLESPSLPYRAPSSSSSFLSRDGRKYNKFGFSVPDDAKSSGGTGSSVSTQSSVFGESGLGLSLSKRRGSGSSSSSRYEDDRRYLSDYNYNRKPASASATASASPFGSYASPSSSSIWNSAIGNSRKEKPRKMQNMYGYGEKSDKLLNQMFNNKDEDGLDLKDKLQLYDILYSNKSRNIGGGGGIDDARQLSG